MPDLLAGMEETVRVALREDAADRDVTTSSLVPAEADGEGTFLVKAEGVIAGLPVVAAVFWQVDPKVMFTQAVEDGAHVGKGKTVATLRGPLGSMLRGERVALNFLQQLSGVATDASHYVAAVKGTHAEILDTRKTTPGLRHLQKYAVRAGGGRNHRLDLSDGMLVKDNHIATLRSRGMSLSEIVVKAIESSPPGLMCEIEVTTVEEAQEAMEAGAKLVLLDNMSLPEMRRAAALAPRYQCKLEASGGITLKTVRAVAETGVDFISVGALTHSSMALDISLEIAEA